MLFAVHALDDPNASAKRQEVHAAHAAHLKTANEYGVTIVMGGPLMSDDGKAAVGSLMVLEASHSGAAEAFNNADPFAKNGVWKKVDIKRFDKRTG